MSILQLADAKLHARITISDDDALIQNQIDAAETWLGLFLGAPLATFIPAASFTGPTFGEAFGVSWHNVPAETMTPTATLPDPLLEALRQLVGFMYDNREAAVVGNFNLTQVSPGFYDLIAPYRAYVF